MSSDATQDASQLSLLGPLERRVMNHLWRQAPQSVGDVQEALNHAETRPLAYTTVMTILVRLHEKGLVTREKEGRQFRYAAAVEESALEAYAGRRELSRLIERYGPDSVARFAVDLGETGLARRVARLARKRPPDS